MHGVQTQEGKKILTATPTIPARRDERFPLLGALSVPSFQCFGTYSPPVNDSLLEFPGTWI